MKAVALSLIAIAGIAGIIKVNFLDREPAQEEDQTLLAPLPLSPVKEPVGDLNAYKASCPLANSFIYPVGPPDGEGYYNAQPFGKNNHLGDDWNGLGGGNTDLGDPIHCVSDGIVFFASDAGPGWGNVIRVYHNIGTKDAPEFVESLYAHVDNVTHAPGDIVKQGEQLGTIGNVNGRYLAHLHLEMRTTIDMPIGGGYSQDRQGFVDPTKFIQAHRIISR